jgi:hypothetical protein
MGEAMGRIPSMISMRAKAISSCSSTDYFLAEAGFTLPVIDLKKSEALGSKTITSDFLANVTL